MLSAEVLACADLCLRRVGTLDFGHEVAKSAAGGTGREREMAAKLAWVDNRIEFHCQHWKAFEQKFIAHFVQRASDAGHMATDESISAGVSGHGGPGKGKGKAVADDEVRPPTRLRPVCTPTTFYKPPDSVQMRVLYEQHFQNVAQEEPCAWDCTMPNCSNRVRTDMVRIGPSNLLRGESGLFARENITEGTVVASFGAVRALRKGEVGTRTRLGYSFIVRETGGRTLELTPRQGITQEYLAHAVNHTCHHVFENCKFLHTGVTKDPRGVGQEDEGGAGGSRTSVVFVQATRRVEREEEFFANYGDSFRFPHGCQCHLCAATAAV